MHWRVRCHANWPLGSRVSAPCGNRTHVAHLTVTRLNRWAIDSYQLNGNNCTWIVVSRNLELLFCVQDCRSGIAQVEYQGQTLYTGTLERKPFIDTSYCVRHRLELNFFSLLDFFAQCSSSSSLISKKWDLRTWNLGQSFEIELRMVGQ